MKMRFYIIYLICFVGLSYAIEAQSVNIDSLKTIYRNSPLSDSSIKTCHEIALAERYTNVDTSEYYFQLAIDQANKINPELKTEVICDYAQYIMTTKNQFAKADSLLQDEIKSEIQNASRPKLLLRLYKEQSLAKANLGEINEGKLSLEKATRLLELPEFSDMDKGVFYNDIAEFYGITSDLEQFTITILNAIDYFNKANDISNVAIGYLNLSIKHIESSRFEKAKSFGEKALELLQDLENDFLLGHNYTVMMVVSSELNAPKEAESYAQKAIKIWQKLELPAQEAGLRRNIATLHRKAKNYQEALKEINTSITQFRKFDNSRELIYCWAEKALIHAKKGDVIASQASLDSMFKLKDVFANNDLEWMSILNTIEEVQAENKDFESAYNTQKEHQLLKDSIVNSENLLKIEELETQYFSKEKDFTLSHQKGQLRQQKYLLWLFGLLIISLLVLAFIFWKNAQYRKSVNAQLRQLDAAKSRFFTNISHELRTPLTLILAPLEDALDKVTSKPIKSNIQLAHSNSKKLLNLVNEIMDLSKLESGKMQSNETNVNLEKLLRRIFYSYHSLAQLRGFILSFSYHLPNDIGVMIDVEKLEKVLNNLLSNAFKYSHIGGAITLRVSHDHLRQASLNNSSKHNKSLAALKKKMLKIEIQDTGKGIPPAELKKVFDRFYQIQDGSEPLQGGTGIGLAYAQEIVRFLDGELMVESEMGKGTNFIIYLPFKKTKIKVVSEDDFDRQNQSQQLAAPQSWKVENGQAKVLIVEDNPEMSKFLVQTLSNHYHCTTALDGNIALELLKDQKFDLITSDVMMPNMDGFEFLKHLKMLEKQRHTPVILLTARAMEDDKLKGFSLGIDDYLTKPFNVKELLARIQNLLKNKASREEFSADKSNKLNEEKPEESLNHEEKQLKMAETIVYENIDNNQFRVEDLAKKMNYSRRQIERIIKKLTGLTPAGFIREIRLQRARILLENRQFATIAEVRYAVGLDNASHFSKIFQERFGVKPSEVGVG